MRTYGEIIEYLDSYEIHPIMDISIQPLSPELIDDYLYFFDNMVFAEHPDWSKCYCYSFHFVGPDEMWTKERNRESVIKLISKGKMKGYLAFANKRPVGWCNANDIKNYQRLKSIYNLDHKDKQKICSIVCFLMDPERRRKGIAKAFLERVISDYSNLGYDFIEAYPHKNNSSCEKNYKGHLSLYERTNFSIVNEHDNNYVVRKALK